MRYDQRATLGKIERMKGTGGNQGLNGSSKNQSLLCRGLNDRALEFSEPSDVDFIVASPKGTD